MTTVVELRQRYLFKTAQCIQVLTDWMASSFLPSFAACAYGGVTTGTNYWMTKNVVALWSRFSCWRTNTTPILSCVLPPISRKQRNKILTHLAAGLPVIYEYFKSERRAHAKAETRVLVQHSCMHCR